MIFDNCLNEFPDGLVNAVMVVDAIEFMRALPDKSVPLIITDPPWPDCDVDFGVSDPWKLFAEFAYEADRLTDRVIVVLGCDTDPRFLSALPIRLPFFRVCWLRRIPGSYRGSLFYSADVAYVFGHRRLNGTDRVIGGESTGVMQTDADNDNPHPTKRHLHHMSWLVRKFSRPGELILDPFCGSGTTLVAAKRAGRMYCGVETNPTFANYSLVRLDEAAGLFDEPRPAKAWTRGNFTANKKKKYNFDTRAKKE